MSHPVSIHYSPLGSSGFSIVKVRTQPRAGTTKKANVKVLVCVDNSGSMARISLNVVEATSVLFQFGPVHLSIFSDTYTSYGNLTSASMLPRSLPVQGQTNIPSIFKPIEIFARGEDNKIIVIVTDGGNSPHFDSPYSVGANGMTLVESFRRNLHQSGNPLIVVPVAVQSGADASLNMKMDGTNVPRGDVKTAYYISTPSSIAKVFDDIVRDLSTNEVLVNFSGVSLEGSYAKGVADKELFSPKMPFGEEKVFLYRGSSVSSTVKDSEGNPMQADISSLDVFTPKDYTDLARQLLDRLKASVIEDGSKADSIIAETSIVFHALLSCVTTVSVLDFKSLGPNERRKLRKEQRNDMYGTQELKNQFEGFVSTYKVMSSAEKWECLSGSSNKFLAKALARSERVPKKGDYNEEGVEAVREAVCRDLGNLATKAVRYPTYSSLCVDPVQLFSLLITFPIELHGLGCRIVNAHWKTAFHILSRGAETFEDFKNGWVVKADLEGVEREDLPMNVSSTMEACLQRWTEATEVCTRVKVDGVIVPIFAASAELVQLADAVSSEVAAYFKADERFFDRFVDLVYQFAKAEQTQCYVTFNTPFAIRNDGWSLDDLHADDVELEETSPNYKMFQHLSKRGVLGLNLQMSNIPDCAMMQPWTASVGAVSFNPMSTSVKFLLHFRDENFRTIEGEVESSPYVVPIIHPATPSMNSKQLKYLLSLYSLPFAKFTDETFLGSQIFALQGMAFNWVMKRPLSESSLLAAAYMISTVHYSRSAEIKETMDLMCAGKMTCSGSFFDTNQAPLALVLECARFSDFIGGNSFVLFFGELIAKQLRHNTPAHFQKLKECMGITADSIPSETLLPKAALEECRKDYELNVQALRSWLTEMLARDNMPFILNNVLSIVTVLEKLQGHVKEFVERLVFMPLVEPIFKEILSLKNEGQIFDQLIPFKSQVMQLGAAVFYPSPADRVSMVVPTLEDLAVKIRMKEHAANSLQWNKIRKEEEALEAARARERLLVLQAKADAKKGALLANVEPMVQSCTQLVGNTNVRISRFVLAAIFRNEGARRFQERESGSFDPTTWSTMMAAGQIYDL